MKIAMANDHAGTSMKYEIKAYLESQGHTVVDFGAYDEQAGCCGSLYRVTEDPAFNHFAIAEGGLMAEECAEALTKGIGRR